jgi:hypothetical protein
MDRDGVIIGVEVADVPSELSLAGCAIVVLLTDVPEDGQVVTEPGDQLPIEEPTLDAQLAVVVEVLVVRLGL